MLIIAPIAGIAIFGCNPSSPTDKLNESARRPSQEWQPKNYVAPLPASMDFDIFTTEKGLCSNTITHLFQDKKGFLWIGTDAGINCFDGYAFRKYRHDENDPYSLPENHIHEIGEDSQGDIWVLTSKGLWQLDPRSGKSAIWHDSLIFSQLSSANNKITIDRQDLAWISCTDSLTYFDITKKKFVRLPEFGGSVHEKEDGDLVAFVSYNHTGDTLEQRKVLLINEASISFETVHDTTYSIVFPPNRGLRYNTATFDGEGNFWGGRQDGYLQKFDFKTRHWSFLAIPPSMGPFHFGTIRSIIFSKSHRSFLLGGYGGLHCFLTDSTAQPRVIRYRHEETNPKSLPVIVVSSVLEDRAGNIWAGTSGGGLCRYAPSLRKFKVFQNNPCNTASLPDKRVEAVHFDQQGRLWAGTAKGLSLLLHPQKQTLKSFYNDPNSNSTRMNNNWIRSIAGDTATGRLLLGYWGDLPNMFDLKTEQFLPLEIANFDKTTWNKTRLPFTTTVIADNKGSVFFGNWGGWVYQYELSSKKFTCHGWEAMEDAKKMGVESGLLTVAYPDRSGVVWFGTDENKGGLVAFDLSKNKAPTPFVLPDRIEQMPDRNAIRYYLPDPEDSTKIPTALIRTIFEDSKKRLWIGSDTGLHWLKDRQAGVFQNYGLREGLPDPFVQSIIEDDQGKLWLGTNNGLCCFDPETGKVLASFDTNDGLPDNQFSPSATAKGKSGELAFGTAAGLCLFHPDSLAHNGIIPSVEITSFEVNGVPHTRTDELVELASFEKNANFEFAALDFSNPSQNRFQYFLEGYDSTWCEPTEAHSVSYTNLSPGKYSLRVRGSNNEQVWNTSGTALSFIIRKPWWQTWWFIAMAGGAIAWGLYQFIQLREKKLRKRQEQNERLIKYLQVQTLQAQINPHFIFNVLGAMQNQILSENPQEANRHLVNLSKLIRRFLDSSISSAPPGKGLAQHEIPLEQEMELLKMYIEFEQLQRQGRFGYEVLVDNSLNIANLTIPPMIVQPYVENAIKHGLLYLDDSEGVGRLVITLAKNEDALCVTIEDNGVGRQRAAEIQRGSHQIYKSHGTRLVEDRVSILNEMGYHITIETNDRDGGGTIVAIKIKD